VAAKSNVSSSRRPVSKNIHNHSAIHGRTEVLEGSAAEDIVILEFLTYEDAIGVVSRLGISSGIEASPPGR